jgi:protein-tyrosine phosphatase
LITSVIAYVVRKLGHTILSSGLTRNGNLLLRMVDIHCHLLPATDDGAKDWETAEAMCRMAIDDGITAAVCTPHANDTYRYDRSRHMETLTELKRRIGDDLDLRLGCDFHLSFENIASATQDPDRFSIAGTDYLLVEFSDFAIPPAVLDALQRFVNIGITPIVTHPERNMMLVRRPEMVLRLAHMGCAIQVTANAFTGRWGNGARRMCEWLIDREAVHIVASDGHDLRSRPPVLSTAREVVRQRYGDDLAHILFQANPEAVIYNKPLPYQPHTRS